MLLSVTPWNLRLGSHPLTLPIMHRPLQIIRKQSGTAEVYLNMGKAHPEDHAALGHEVGGVVDGLVRLAAQAPVRGACAPVGVHDGGVHGVVGEGVRAGGAAVQHQRLRRPRHARLHPKQCALVHLAEKHICHMPNRYKWLLTLFCYCAFRHAGPFFSIVCYEMCM